MSSSSEEVGEVIQLILFVSVYQWDYCKVIGQFH